VIRLSQVLRADLPPAPKTDKATLDRASRRVAEISSARRDPPTAAQVDRSCWRAHQARTSRRGMAGEPYYFANGGTPRTGKRWRKLEPSPKSSWTNSAGGDVAWHRPCAGSRLCAGSRKAARRSCIAVQAAQAVGRSGGAPLRKRTPRLNRETRSRLLDRCTPAPLSGGASRYPTRPTERLQRRTDQRFRWSEACRWARQGLNL
jgi:hypothetical protein